ncbi:thiamine pyrophosphate-dependent enzyme [uncultured Albimonas sp.]|uniref:thiamine pyrophosphate-dependent enzyme n=1 Tax=uncultured Albimonas sp. TaxID=1331701 RepID=UPI0030EE2202|tara:strand:- start:478 stop:1077 length:600 start_codon:yes stop_codon:yes gene_type:complete
MVSGTVERRAAVAALMAHRGEGEARALVISGLGSPTWDLNAAGDDPANFYLWGAMGGAAMVALGVAQAQPSRRVMALTGDGEQLMALGALATIGAAGPANLTVLVLDNERYGETGAQPSHTGRGTELAAVAAACGFAETEVARSLAEVEALGARLAAPAQGPRLFVVKIGAETPPRSMPARDAPWLKSRFRARLGFEPG